jgi:hypothetical protein
VQQTSRGATQRAVGHGWHSVSAAARDPAASPACAGLPAAQGACVQAGTCFAALLTAGLWTCGDTLAQASLLQSCCWIVLRGAGSLNAQSILRTTNIGLCLCLTPNTQTQAHTHTNTTLSTAVLRPPTCPSAAAAGSC